MSTPHRPLNNKQLDILRVLYRFRFATTDLLVQALGTKSTINMNERLKVLLDQEYIGRKFSAEYRLLHKPASYYSLSKGIAALKAIPDNEFSPSVLRNIYKDKTASGRYIEYCLAVFAVYCQLQKTYGERMDFFTRSELAGVYDYFSEFAPNAYMRLDVDGQEKNFFVEHLQGSKPFFAIIQRLKEYIEYADSGDWEAATDSDFPAILLVCDSEKLLNRLMKSSELALSEADDDLKFYVTTPDKLEEWQSLTDKDEEPCRLTEI